MSDAYIRHAKRQLRRSRTSFIVGKAEEIPLSDNSQDAVTSTFLFHELPPKVRRIALRECARVLKPGGRLVLLDSLQRGDRPDYEGLLELFPRSYHEPCYSSYIKGNLASLASECGLSNLCEARRTFLPKLWFSTNPLREEKAVRHQRLATSIPGFSTII